MIKLTTQCESLQKDNERLREELGKIKTGVSGVSYKDIIDKLRTIARAALEAKP